MYPAGRIHLRERLVRFIKFYAELCGPCKSFEPVLKMYAEEHGLDILTIDIDKIPKTAERFGVMSVPTTVLMQDHEELARVVGAKPSFQLEQAFDKFMN